MGPFERICCINLRGRTDRWQRFESCLPHPWPLAPVQRVEAVDGIQSPPPDWWRAGPGAWGCYRSHLRLIEEALNDGVESLLIFEDDAQFVDDFEMRLYRFLAAVPEDWGMLYLGGQHLKAERFPPLRLNDQVCIPHNVNRTHAYALRGDTLRAVYRHLTSDQWRPGNHIDHHLGRFVERHDRRYPVYAPRSWLVGQAGGASNIAERAFPERFWSGSTDRDWECSPLVAVVGLHSSGSSALAGVIWSLGLYFGEALGGFYGNQPGCRCGYEARELSELCESIIPFLSTESVVDQVHQKRLWEWLYLHRIQGARIGAIPAIKYPQLCRLGGALRDLVGDRLRLVVSERPLEDSIRSLQQRCPGRSAQDIATHQRWLWEGLQEFKASIPEDHQLSIDYENLLAHPEEQALELANFLGIREPHLEAHIARAVTPIRLYRKKSNAPEVALHTE